MIDLYLKTEDDYPFILPTKMGITCTAQTYFFSYSYLPSLYVERKTYDDIRLEIQPFLDNDEEGGSSSYKDLYDSIKKKNEKEANI